MKCNNEKKKIAFNPNYPLDLNVDYQKSKQLSGFGISRRLNEKKYKPFTSLLLADIKEFNKIQPYSEI